MNQAGITKVGSCHLFRHTAASLMLDAGADIRHLQAILGHESLCTTQIYTHVSIGKLCQVHERTHPGRLFRAPRAAEASASIFSLVQRRLGWLVRRPVALATTPPARQQPDVAPRWLASSASNSGPPEKFGSGGHLSLFTSPHDRVQWLADL